MIDFNALQRSATAAVGALVISTAFIAAAIGPVEAGASRPTAIAASAQPSAHAEA